MKPRPSIRARLSKAILVWAVAWGTAVTAAIALTVPHEVDELLDDTLQSSAEVLAILLSPAREASHAGRSELADALPRVFDDALLPEDRFAWQVVNAGGLVVLRSTLAPETPLHPGATPGFSDLPDWRVYGSALPGDGRMLYVAQTLAERFEAKFEVGFGATLAALGIGLLGLLWLRVRVRQELAPLEELSQRVGAHDPTAEGASLGDAQREELQPLQSAIDDLGRRLAARLASERAFAAHAAHALRTPLAGIDAQLAVALRESPPEIQPRIRRAREAAARLHGVVSALLVLFRSNADLRRERIDLHDLLSKLPVEGLTVRVHGEKSIDADPDLLAAVLLNLADNALRYGARKMRIEAFATNTIRVHDDGPGVSGSRREQLQAAIADAGHGRRTGLGLALAGVVARAHGGRVVLPDVPGGFAVDLVLGGGD